MSEIKTDNSDLLLQHLCGKMGYKFQILIKILAIAFFQTANFYEIC